MVLEELIALTSDLIRIPSTALRPVERVRCADALAAWMQREGIAHERVEQGGVPSFIVAGPAKKAPVTLLAHFDVVEGPDAVFIPSVRDGRLYGRGSSDDKYACALSLLLYREHLREIRAKGGDQADMPFMLLLTGDEEIGGHNGAEFLAPQISTEFCMAIDSAPETTLTVRQKGYLRLTLTAKGKAAHGAYPWEGDNAILALARDCLALESFFASLVPKDPALLAAHWHPTCNIGVVRAGGSVNQVPDKAEADLDIRFTEADDPDALIAAMQARLAGTLTESRARGLPVYAGESPWLTRLMRHLPGVTPGNAHGACDTRHFSPRGIPCVAWGADNEDSQHMENEHLVLDSAAFVYKSLDAFLRDIR